MFSTEFWYIGVLASLVLASQVLAVLYLAQHKWIGRIVLWLLALYMLITQSMRINETHTFDWAFSTIAYWLLIAGAVVPLRPIKSVSAAFCLVAGSVYTAGFVIYPPMMSHMGQFGISYMSAFLLHDVLFFGALVMYTQFKVKRFDCIYLGVLLAAVVVITELGAYVWDWHNINDFLQSVIEGDALQTQLFPNIPLTWWWYVVWYVGLAGALCGIWALICLINKRLTRFRTDFGLLAW